MPFYVDGFVVPVPKKKLDTYLKFARKAAKVWREYGALQCVECVGDDVPVGKQTSFTRAVELKKDEVVVFSWITYKSRADRDRVMKRVMADPRLQMAPEDRPFDAKRMIFGGFKSRVAL
ncbi:DUF1428 domain-containing protein [Roseiterribacter gracilis]|uniref:RNA signal recognition particle n=1 Tax=Roseiterribacter gracilis TaxID=2812848 RepID=A0A8S8XHV2_9PROT|nr:RNA signal recognition particle [Rhodospirillales bacterium TMPK1]